MNNLRNQVILITSLHTYIVSDLWPGLAPAVTPEPVRTRLFGPVSTLSSASCAQNSVSRRRQIRHFRRCLRTSRRLLGTMGLRFSVLSLQTQSKLWVLCNGHRKKTLRPKAETHPGRTGPEARKPFFVLIFSAQTT